MKTPTHTDLISGVLWKAVLNNNRNETNYVTLRLSLCSTHNKCSSDSFAMVTPHSTCFHSRKDKQDKALLVFYVTASSRHVGQQQLRNYVS